MTDFLSFYQHIPGYLNPVAFSIFGFPIDWYSLMYLAGFLAVYFLLRYRIKKGENNETLNTEKLLDLMIAAFFGLLVGGRLGYVLFYNFSYYAARPLEIISPFDASGNFVGIYGMSYHGALIGAILTGYLYVKAKKLNFLNLANFVVPAIPLGYFFGRIGNFINGELYGRVTDKFWGMYFPLDSFGLLRHPSQLYEAILEGVILFILLWSIRNNKKYKKHLLAFYLMGYGVMRIIGEFFREPDIQIGYILGFFTLGQILSAGMISLGVLLIYGIIPKRTISKYK